MPDDLKLKGAAAKAKAAKKAPKPGAPARRRRTTEEVLDRIIAAATEEFERHGYAGAKTAAIARRAGVAEALIFVHFGTKARLFHDAIFEPLNRHIVAFCASHLAENPEAMASDTKEYIQQLQRFIERHSRMLLSLVMAHTFPAESQPEFSKLDGLNAYFARACELARRQGRARKTDDLQVMSRLAFAAILAPIIFKSWLFPEEVVSARRLSSAITEFIFAGIQWQNK